MHLCDLKYIPSLLPLHQTINQSIIWYPVISDYIILLELHHILDLIIVRNEDNLLCYGDSMDFRYKVHLHFCTISEMELPSYSWPYMAMIKQDYPVPHQCSTELTMYWFLKCLSCDTSNCLIYGRFRNCSRLWFFGRMYYIWLSSQGGDLWSPNFLYFNW